MVELKNCENCKHRRIRSSRGYPCMCCELLNPISFNSKWEEEPPKQGYEREITEEEANKQYNKAYAEEYCNAHPFL